MVPNVFYFLNHLFLWLCIANWNETILYLQKIVKKINEKEIRYQVCRSLVYMYILTDHVLEMIILYPSNMYYSISIYHNSPIQDIYLNIEDILYL